MNPAGRVFYCASTMVCTPASEAQEVGLALVEQAGQKRLREVAMAGSPDSGERPNAVSKT